MSSTRFDDDIRNRIRCIKLKLVEKENQCDEADYCSIADSQDTAAKLLLHNQPSSVLVSSPTTDSSSCFSPVKDVLACSATNWLTYKGSVAEQSLCDDRALPFIAKSLTQNYNSNVCLQSNNYKKKKWGSDDFEWCCKLGRGVFGTVFLCREKFSHEYFAIKVMKKKQVEMFNCQKNVEREIKIQNLLSHPNILRFFAYFHEPSRIYLVLEYAPGGDVYKLLEAYGRFSEQCAATYIYQVCHAVNYCHERQVMHRDIKPENLLLSHSGSILLTDFGSAVMFSENCNNELCGTPNYQAPEVVQRLPYDYRVDIWATGVLAFEFLAGCPPFRSLTQEEKETLIVNADYTCPDHFCDDARQFISGVLLPSPAMRCSLSAQLTHKFILKFAIKSLTEGPVHLEKLDCSKIDSV